MSRSIDDKLSKIMIAFQERESFWESFNKKVESRQFVMDTIVLYFLFPSFLVGLYGMNVELPFMKKPYAFYLILMAILAWIIGVTYFKQRFF